MRLWLGNNVPALGTHRVGAKKLTPWLGSPDDSGFGGLPPPLLRCTGLSAFLREDLQSTWASAAFCLPGTALPHFGENSGLHQSPLLGGMLLPARERANHFFPCFAASSLACCFGEVHNHGDYSEDMYIYLCFITPTIFPDSFPSPQTGLRYIWASFMPSWNWIANSYSNENTYAAA